MSPDDIISYAELVAVRRQPKLKTEPLKTANYRLRRSGMNYGIGKTYSVFLMSVRPGAPYRDQVGSKTRLSR